MWRLGSSSTCYVYDRDPRRSVVDTALEFRGLRPWWGLSPSLRVEDSIPIQREEGREEGEKGRRRVAKEER